DALPSCPGRHAGWCLPRPRSGSPAAHQRRGWSRGRATGHAHHVVSPMPRLGPYPDHSALALTALALVDLAGRYLPVGSAYPRLTYHWMVSSSCATVTLTPFELTSGYRWRALRIFAISFLPGLRSQQTTQRRQRRSRTRPPPEPQPSCSPTER